MPRTLPRKVPAGLSLHRVRGFQDLMAGLPSAKGWKKQQKAEKERRGGGGNWRPKKNAAVEDTLIRQKKRRLEGSQRLSDGCEQ